MDAAHDAGLRIATAPHASCKAVATNGPKKIALGSARDANGDGTVVLVPKLTAKLGRGTWHVVAACGGANATATISVGA